MMPNPIHTSSCSIAGLRLMYASLASRPLFPDFSVDLPPRHPLLLDFLSVFQLHKSR